MGPVERWVDAAHANGADLVPRIKHAVRCMCTYIQVVQRPQRKEREAREERERRKRRARWNICAMLVRIHKEEK